MPNQFLREHTAVEIAEIMAYYRIKAEDREAEKSREHIEQQRRAARGRR